mmetsp:Transcript_15003/g.43639  ORF Transcript_15003/g.43639 Transcript_15003/m.43639 type:complete len:97 (-) Transcript_15003:187-477(-)
MQGRIFCKKFLGVEKGGSSPRARERESERKSHDSASCRIGQSQVLCGPSRMVARPPKKKRGCGVGTKTTLDNDNDDDNHIFSTNLLCVCVLVAIEH